MGHVGFHGLRDPLQSPPSSGPAHHIGGVPGNSHAVERKEEDDQHQEQRCHVQGQDPLAAEATALEAQGQQQKVADVC